MVVIIVGLQSLCFLISVSESYWGWHLWLLFRGELAMCVHVCVCVRVLGKCALTVGIVSIMLHGYWALWPFLGKC